MGAAAGDIARRTRAAQFWATCGSVEWAAARTYSKEDDDSEDEEDEQDVVPSSVPTLHVDDVSPDCFVRDYLARRNPLVMRGIIERWPASSKWTLDFFEHEHGDVCVAVDVGGGKQRSTRLADFVHDMGSPSYLRLWHFDEDVPQLADDFTIPDHVDDYFARLPPYLQPPRRPRWIFIGPAGSYTPLHLDPWATHAWFAQIKGRKQFMLYPPADVRFVCDVHSGTFADPSAPDLLRFPHYNRARCLKVVLEAGDWFYLPAGWAHAVSTLDGPSISLTANFLDQRSFREITFAYTLFILRASNQSTTSKDTKDVANSSVVLADQVPSAEPLASISTKVHEAQ